MVRKHIIGAILDIPGRGQRHVYVLGESIKPHNEDPNSLTLKYVDRAGIKGMFPATLPERSFSDDITLPRGQLYFYPSGMDTNGIDHRKCDLIFGLMHKADHHSSKLLKKVQKLHSDRMDEKQRKIELLKEEVEKLKEEVETKTINDLAAK